MNKKVLSIIVIVLLAMAGYSFFNQRTKPQSEPVSGGGVSKEMPLASITPENIDHTAGFAIFTNGTFRIFTDPKYHQQSKEIFITAVNPNIVYVKKDATWDDFFQTLPMKLTRDCLTTGTGQTFCSEGNNKLRFYINGTENKDALTQKIRSGDKLLVSYGNESDAQIQAQLQSIPDVE